MTALTPAGRRILTRLAAGEELMLRTGMVLIHGVETRRVEGYWIRADGIREPARFNSLELLIEQGFLQAPAIERVHGWTFRKACLTVRGILRMRDLA